MKPPPLHGQGRAFQRLWMLLPEPPPRGVPESFLPNTMTYKVRLQYAINVDAESVSAAYRKAAALIKQEPGIALRRVESPVLQPLWKMLLFGV